MSLVTSFFAAIFTFLFFAIPATIVMCFRREWRRQIIPIWKMFIIIAAGAMVSLVGITEYWGSTRLLGATHWFTGLQLYLSATWLSLAGFLLWCFTKANPLDPARLWLILFAVPLWMLVYFPWHLAKNNQVSKRDKYLWAGSFLVGWLFLVPVPAIAYFIRYMLHWPSTNVDSSQSYGPKLIAKEAANDAGQKIDLKSRQKLNIKDLLDRD